VEKEARSSAEEEAKCPAGHSNDASGDRRAPALAAPDKNDPPSYSCGLNNPNNYKDGGEVDEGDPGAGELGMQPENHPLAFGCAPGPKDPSP
jgi:hypothetical protein